MKESLWTLVTNLKQRPAIGQEVLVKRVTHFGQAKYDVAIYAKANWDKRRHGFFENNHPHWEGVMPSDAVLLMDVLMWMPIPPE